ncbi:hypothetical protein TNCV_4269301 [Trichonephila clavipes]|nr:hypothetical protein TNCV_4269301 [Trichonephila clavipes]
MPAVSTSSSSTQTYLLLSTSAILPTIQSETLLPIPIPTTTSPSNSLNTSASSLKIDTRVYFLQIPINLLHYQLKCRHQFPYQSLQLLHPIMNLLTHSKAIKTKLKKIEKSVQKKKKAEIEIKMTPHTPSKSYVHHTSEDEDMIVDEDEHLYRA